MLDQPAPHATSATAAGGSAGSRSWTSGTPAATRAEQVRELRAGWRRLRLEAFLAVAPSTATPPPVRKASSTAGSAEAKETAKRAIGTR